MEQLWITLVLTKSIYVAKPLQAKLSRLLFFIGIATYCRYRPVAFSRVEDRNPFRRFVYSAGHQETPKPPSGGFFICVNKPLV